MPSLRASNMTLILQFFPYRIIKRALGEPVHLFSIFLVKNWIHFLTETIESIGFQALEPWTSGK
jgi:hypothetical protein